MKEWTFFVKTLVDPSCRLPSQYKEIPKIILINGLWKTSYNFLVGLLGGSPVTFGYTGTDNGAWVWSHWREALKALNDVGIQNSTNLEKLKTNENMLIISAQELKDGKIDFTSPRFTSRDS